MWDRRKGVRHGENEIQLGVFPELPPLDLVRLLLRDEWPEVDDFLLMPAVQYAGVDLVAANIPGVPDVQAAEELGEAEHAHALCDPGVVGLEPLHGCGDGLAAVGENEAGAYLEGLVWARRRAG